MRVEEERSLSVVTKNGFERKCVVIDRDFQFRYLLTWILMTMTLLGGLVLASVSMFYVFKVRAMNHLVIGNAVCALAITLLSMRYMVRHSHRIAGPAFRLERTIREIADGTYEGYVTLRRKDYLKHVADSVNYLIDRLDEHRGELVQLRRVAEAVHQAVADNALCSSQVKELAGRLSAELGEMSMSTCESDRAGEDETSETDEAVEMEEVGV